MQPYRQDTHTMFESTLGVAQRPVATVKRGAANFQ
jgi:hypothetical protein